MKTVLIRGPVLTQSGYGVHARQITRWLLERKGDTELFVQALPWGNTPWYLSEEAQNGLIGKIMQRARPFETPRDVSFQIQLPNEWDERLAKYNVGVTAAIETDRCNPDWIKHCNKMDEIIVPSKHAKLSLVNSGNISVPISVIPESFHDAIVLPDEELPPCPLQDLSTTFNFLLFGQITGSNPHNDRKNLFYTIRWLCEEFKDNPEIGIVLKTNTARNTKIDRNNVMRLVKEVVNEVRKGEFPKIHVLHGSLTEEEVATVYRHPSIKALVSLTRGEGFGLPTLEAAASGLPVIATGWSGHMDFMKLGKFIEVHYELKEVHESRVDDNLFMKNARWAEASEPDFKRRAQKLYNSSKIPKQWAKDLQEKLIKNNSFETIANHYESAFKEKLAL